MQAIIEAFKKDVDRTLLRENLKLTPQKRFDKFTAVMKNLMAIQAAGELARTNANDRPQSASEQ
jgi:hypothetical protein